MTLDIETIISRIHLAKLKGDIHLAVYYSRELTRLLEKEL